jgi:hypothetical protein
MNLAPPLCGPAFLQVARDRRPPSNVLSVRGSQRDHQHRTQWTFSGIIAASTSHWHCAQSGRRCNHAGLLDHSGRWADAPLGSDCVLDSCENAGGPCRHCGGEHDLVGAQQLCHSDQVLCRLGCTLATGPEAAIGFRLADHDLAVEDHAQVQLRGVAIARLDQQFRRPKDWSASHLPSGSPRVAGCRRAS